MEIILESLHLLRQRALHLAATFGHGLDTRVATAITIEEVLHLFAPSRLSRVVVGVVGGRMCLLQQFDTIVIISIVIVIVTNNTTFR